jgi:hypothetical protein
MDVTMVVGAHGEPPFYRAVRPVCAHRRESWSWKWLGGLGLWGGVILGERIFRV